LNQDNKSFTLKNKYPDQYKLLNIVNNFELRLINTTFEALSQKNKKTFKKLKKSFIKMKKSKKYKSELYDYYLNENINFKHAKNVVDNNNKYSKTNLSNDFNQYNTYIKLNTCFPPGKFNFKTKILVTNKTLSINHLNRTIYHPTKNKKYHFEIFCLYIENFTKKEKNVWTILFKKTSYNFLNNNWSITSTNFESYTYHSKYTLHYPSLKKVSNRKKRKIMKHYTSDYFPGKKKKTKRIIIR